VQDDEVDFDLDGGALGVRDLAGRRRLLRLYRDAGGRILGD
jgi:hypothetical protein